MKFILASASPRRQELIKRITDDFDIIVSGADEDITKERPADIVEELALKKASAVFEEIKDSCTDDLCVVGADTIVVYGDEILGKPADENDARDMLSLLADRTHCVYTGVCLIIRRNGGVIKSTFNERTEVTFYPITRFEIDEYIATGDPLDKAGSYGIQGSFLKHIRSIKGDYSNVVGLPVGKLYQELKALHVL